MECDVYVRLLIRRRHGGQERRVAESTAAGVDNTDEGE